MRGRGEGKEACMLSALQEEGEFVVRISAAGKKCCREDILGASLQAIGKIEVVINAGQLAQLQG